LYFIQGLNGIKIKSIMVNYRDWIFEDFFYKFYKYCFLFIILLYIL